MINTTLTPQLHHDYTILTPYLQNTYILITSNAHTGTAGELETILKPY
jgi:hypothetical protein